MQKQHELEFGLTVPQGWRGGDLPLEEENDPVKQYEFSKSISVTADSIGFDSIYAYDHFIPFYRDDVKSVDRILFPPRSPIPPTTEENLTIPNDEL